MIFFSLIIFLRSITLC